MTPLLNVRADLRPVRAALCYRSMLVAAMALASLIPVVSASGATNHMASSGLGMQVAELRGMWDGPNRLFASSVAGSAQTLVVGSLGMDAAFVYQRTDAGYSQTAVLRAAGTNVRDIFGQAVAIYGRTIVVTAPHHAPSGSAYVFTSTAVGWKLTARLSTRDLSVGDVFGESAAVSNDTIVIGANTRYGRGRAYVFGRQGGGWRQVAEMRGSTTRSDDFGYSVALSGAFLAVGAPGTANGGAALVYTRTGSTWTYKAQLQGLDTVAGDAFGTSVGVAGSTVVVGAWHHGRGGRAYVFVRIPGRWEQRAELHGNDTTTGDAFGTSVGVTSPRGTTVIVGAWRHARAAGAAYLFRHSAAGWTQVAALQGADTTAGDLFGQAVAAFGSYAAIGAVWHAHHEGRAYVFHL